MKRLIAVVLVCLLFSFSLMPFSFAVSSETEYREVYEDGSYLTEGFCEEVIEENAVTSFLSRLINIIRKIISRITGNKSVSMTKYASYYDSKGTLLWTVYLTAEFSYNGEKAACKKVSYSYDIYDSDWNFISADCSKNGDTATGVFIIKQYKLAVPLKTAEKRLTLLCDKDGNIT